LKYLFKENLDRKFKKAKRLFLFLDFDGTLAPIVKTPYQAKVSSSTKDILSSLAKKKRIILGIISGRILEDIKKKVGIKNIFYVGNHGLEIYFKGKKILLIKKIKEYLRILEKIKKDLKENLKKIKGVIFEDKKLIYAVHYRLVATSELKKFKKKFKKIIFPYLKENKIKIGKGKRVLEIRPNVSFGKHIALRFLQKLLKKKKGDFTIYIGDDLTDEEVFSSLNKEDLSIKVGKTKKSKAKYYLNDVKEVEKFLKHLNTTKIL
jgi:trehalose-phosphatase